MISQEEALEALDHITEELGNHGLHDIYQSMSILRNFIEDRPDSDEELLQ